MRNARIPVFGGLALSGAATVAVALLPGMDSASRLPLLRVALDTAPPLIALVAAFAVCDRLRRGARLNELILACSISALALSELVFVTVPVLLQRFWPDLSVWAALAGSAFGAALFALAAFVPRRRLRQPGLALAAGEAAVTTTLVLIAVLAAAFAARWPEIPVAATAKGLPAGPDLDADVLLPALEIMVAAIYGLAAADSFAAPKDSMMNFSAGSPPPPSWPPPHMSITFFIRPFTQSLPRPAMCSSCAFTRCCWRDRLREIWSYWTRPRRGGGAGGTAAHRTRPARRAGAGTGLPGRATSI